jgi:hypothetical protein
MSDFDFSRSSAHPQTMNKGALLSFVLSERLRPKK